MSRYFVLGFVDATIPKTIEADTPEDARDAFLAETSVTVCSYCSDKMDVGDVYDAEVMTEDQSEVLIRREADDEREALKARLAALEKVAEAARMLCAELTTDRLPGGGAQWREALALREALAELDKAGDR